MIRLFCASVLVNREIHNPVVMLRVFSDDFKNDSSEKLLIDFKTLTTSSAANLNDKCVSINGSEVHICIKVKIDSIYC